MRRIILVLGALLWSVAAQAGVTCTLPYTLTNNTTADATQVMANYNALVTCLTSAAHAGANSDITSLSALTTPLSVAQGGTSAFIGGTSTGTANAQVVATTSPTSFTLTAGYKVSFIAGFTNTGALTLNINSTGATNVYRRTQLGVVTTAGGDIVAGENVEVIFDGTQFQILSGERQYIGEIKDWTGATAPAGYAFADGSCQLRVGVYASLYSVVGTTYDPTGSTCDVNHFAMPDGRGRLFAGKDDMGGVAANRITNAASSCTGTTLGGAGCGSQTATIGQTHLPAVTLTTTVGAGQGSHTHALDSGGSPLSSGGGNNGQAGSDYGRSASNISAATLPAMSGTTPLGGSGTGLPVLNPLQIVNKIIKY